MQKSESIAKLSEALSLAQGKITGALKDASNPFFRSQYADLQSVWDAIREPLSSNGLAVIQLPGRDEKGLFVETILSHSSGEWISGMLQMTPVKDDPQGIGSAITYARRYALQAIAGVAPMDDDAEGAMGRPHKKNDPIEERQERREQEANFPLEPRPGSINRREAADEIKGWRDVECTFGKKNGPLRGKKLGELNESNLKYLCDMFLVDGKGVKPADAKMVAALSIWKAEQSTPAKGAAASGEYNGPKHKELAECLVWETPEISQDDFIAAMKYAKEIPQDAKSFGAMSEETATKFIQHYEDAKELVREYLAKQNPAS